MKPKWTRLILYCTWLFMCQSNNLKTEDSPLYFDLEQYRFTLSEIANEPKKHITSDDGNLSVTIYSSPLSFLLDDSLRIDFFDDKAFDEVSIYYQFNTSVLQSDDSRRRMAMINNEHDLFLDELAEMSDEQRQVIMEEMGFGKIWKKAKKSTSKGLSKLGDEKTWKEGAKGAMNYGGKALDEGSKGAMKYGGKALEATRKGWNQHAVPGLGTAWDATRKGWNQDVVPGLGTAWDEGSKGLMKYGGRAWDEGSKGAMKYGGKAWDATRKGWNQDVVPGLGTAWDEGSKGAMKYGGKAWDQGSKGAGNAWNQQFEGKSKERAEICNLPKLAGPCKRYFIKFYFDSTKQVCNAFVYGGCGGNENRFGSSQECASRCNIATETNPIQDICRLSPDTGRCRGSFPRFFYDSGTQKCETFKYGGCGGNKNRFQSEKECSNKCNGVQSKSQPSTTAEPYGTTALTTRDIDFCRLPSQTGRCRGAFPRFFYDSGTEKCETFNYGGCGGNQNRFRSQKECSNKCGGVKSKSNNSNIDIPWPSTTVTPTTTEIDLCKFPPEEGPCLAGYPRFFYDHATGQCESFTYGGCDGNTNNFLTMQQCIDTCKLHAPPPWDTEQSQLVDRMKMMKDKRKKGKEKMKNEILNEMRNGFMRLKEKLLEDQMKHKEELNAQVNAMQKQEMDRQWKIEKLRQRRRDEKVKSRLERLQLRKQRLKLRKQQQKQFTQQLLQGLKQFLTAYKHEPRAQVRRRGLLGDDGQSAAKCVMYNERKMCIKYDVNRGVILLDVMTANKKRNEMDLSDHETRRLVSYEYEMEWNASGNNKCVSLHLMPFDVCFEAKMNHDFAMYFDHFEIEWMSDELWSEIIDFKNSKSVRKCVNVGVEKVCLTYDGKTLFVIEFIFEN
eukprot:588376_1